MTKASSSISTELPSLSLAPSTWSYTPQQHNADSIKNGSKNNAAWSDGTSSSLASELWSSINPGKQASNNVGPPGLGSISSSGSKLVTSSSWGGLGRSAWPGEQRSSQPTSNSALPSQGGWPSQLPPSTWLILKNLTPQVSIAVINWNWWGNVCMFTLSCCKTRMLMRSISVLLIAWGCCKYWLLSLFSCTDWWVHTEDPVHAAWTSRQFPLSPQPRLCSCQLRFSRGSWQGTSIDHFF